MVGEFGVKVRNRLVLGIALIRRCALGERLGLEPAVTASGATATTIREVVINETRGAGPLRSPTRITQR